MAAVDVGAGLLGSGTVGSAVSRTPAESRDEIERATGHRLDGRARYPLHEVRVLPVAREGPHRVEAPQRSAANVHSEPRR
jgi:hypothetical protein